MKKHSEILLPDEEATGNFAKKLAERLTQSFVLYFQGEIGVGKTTCIRAILKSLGVTEKIKSPTFTLVETYHLNQLLCYHFDLYRITSPEELEYIGLRDYLTDNAVCLIEWPERGESFLPPPDVICFFNFEHNGRKLGLTATTDKGAQLIDGI